MKGLKSTAALVVVLAGLGAYIYFVTWKQPSSDTPKEDKVFASVKSDKIDELKVRSASGDTTTLKKSGGTWALTAPVSAAADEADVSGITSNLGTLSITRVVDENPTDLKQYGLATPRIEVDFQQEGDKTGHRLLLGDKSPTGGDLFAQRDGEKRVFLVSAFQESTFNRSPFDLRDKTLIKFDRDKVDGLTVDADGKTIQIAKDGGDWKLEKPLQVQADFGSVEELVGRLQSVQMKSIVASDATPADLKKFGLDKPAATVTFDIGSARASLVLGGAADATSIYARDSSRPMVMTVESALLTDLKKGADAYRRKDIFAFRAYNATHVELTRGGQTVVFEKVKGTGKDAQDTWRRVSPNAKDVDKDTMDGMLTKFANMRAASFVDASAKTGLDSPALTMDVKYEDGKKTEKVTFGSVGGDVYAAVPGQPGAAKVDSTDFNEALKQLDELSK